MVRKLSGFFFFLLYAYYVCSDKVITHNKRFNITAKMGQRMSEFCTKILILLKPSLIHVHLRDDAMVI